MSNLFKVSEAAALALHASALMAGAQGRLLRTREIARRLNASEAHLAKVLLSLQHAGLVRSMRGPSGGSQLARPADRITLRHIYEAVEGPLKVAKCMFKEPVCGRPRCALGGFLRDVNQQVVDKLRNTRLSDFVLELGG
ncbi:MAG: Rrf2 family transcriptional regulator [candidate division WOR-3 bacterium]|nr:MAG: Rrf2 family transcriptional regulator [candidate division WOR-3 bacterium]